MRIVLRILVACLVFPAYFFGGAAGADDLYRNGNWANLASDNKAHEIGDLLTVIVYQSAEARNSSRLGTRRRTSFDVRAGAGTFQDQANLDFDRESVGSGEMRRSESLLTQFSLQVVDVYANGDLEVAGEQTVHVNGDVSTIRIRGRVRTVDISPDNQVISTQIANAEIVYDGSGYVSRSARPGLISRLFLLFGL